MRRVFRRIGAVILVLCLLISMLSAAVLAEDGNSPGGNPLESSDASDNSDATGNGGASDNVNASDNGDATGNGDASDNGDATGNGGASDNGDATGNGGASDNVDATGNGGASDNSDAPDNGDATGNGGASDNGVASDNGDATGNGDASDNSDVSGNSNKLRSGGSLEDGTEITGEIKYSASDYSGVYDGKAHSISVSVTSPEGASVSYAYPTDGTYSSQNPAFTNAGNYKVAYKIEKELYETETGIATVVIERADVSDVVESSLKSSFTYDGNPVQFAPFHEGIEAWELSYSNDDGDLDAAPSAPGRYSVKIVGSGPNHTAVIFHSFTIDQEEQVDETIQYSASGYSGTYDGQPHSILLNVTTEGASATYATSQDGEYTATLPSFTEPGEYIVWFRLEKENYATVTGSASVTITELGRIEYTVSDYSGYYDGEAHTIDLVAAEGVSVTYATSEDGEYSAMLPSFTEPGMYTVWFKLEKENYKTVTGSATVAIAELGEIEYTVSGYSGYYDGAAHTIDLVAAEGVSVTYATSEDGAYSATLPSFTEPGTYTVWFKLEKENCETVVDSASVTITELGEIEYTVSDYSGYYDGKAHTITLNIATEGVTATFASSEDSAYTATQPSFTEPGEYTVWFRLEKEGYETKCDFGVVEIRKTDIEYSVKGYTGHYNGKPHSISLYVKTPGATVTYATSRDGTYTDTMPGFTDPGTYTVWFKIEKNDHTSVLDSETVTIKPGQIHYTVSDYKGVYDGEGHSITLSVFTPGATVTYTVEDKFGLTGGLSFSHNPSLFNVGTFKVLYRIEKHGYETVNGSATVTIEKSEPKLYFDKSVNVLSPDGTAFLSGGFLLFCEQGVGAVTVSSSSGIVARVPNNKSDPPNSFRYAVSCDARVETPVTVTATVAETMNYKAATATCIFVRSDEIDAYFIADDSQAAVKTEEMEQTVKIKELDLTLRPVSNLDDESLLGASSDLRKKLMASVGASQIGSMAVDAALVDNQTGMEVHNVSGDLTLKLTGDLQQSYQKNYKNMACVAVHIKQDVSYFAPMPDSTPAPQGTTSDGAGASFGSSGFSMSGGTIPSSAAATDGAGVYAGSSSFSMSGGTIPSSVTGSGNGSATGNVGASIGVSSSGANGTGTDAAAAGNALEGIANRIDNIANNASASSADKANALKDAVGEMNAIVAGGGTGDPDKDEVLNEVVEKLSTITDGGTTDEAALNGLLEQIVALVDAVADLMRAEGTGTDKDVEDILNAIKAQMSNARENSSGEDKDPEDILDKLKNQLGSSSAGNSGMTSQQAGSSSSSSNSGMTSQQAGSSSVSSNSGMTSQQAGSSSSAGGSSMTSQQAGIGSSTSKLGALGRAMGSLSPNVEIITCQMTSNGVRVPGTSLSPFLLIYGPKEAFSNLLTVRAKDGVFTYDGEGHAVAAEPSIAEGTTLYYSLDLENWQTEAPSFTDVRWNEDGSVGSYQVYVLAENPDCDPAVCSYTVTIVPQA